MFVGAKKRDMISFEIFIATSKRLWSFCECVFTTILPTCYVLCVTSNRMHFRTIPFHSSLTFSFLGDCCCRWKSAFTCGGSLKTFFFLFCFGQNYSNFWKNCLKKKRLTKIFNQHRVPLYVGEAAKFCFTGFLCAKWQI